MGAGSATSAEAPKTKAGQSWGGNLGKIVAFLQSKGFNNYAIAGILGNLREESNDSTTALNQREGAIGLAQWEGGRRTALQNWAAAHGMHETDLNAQLGYMWHELTTSDSGVLAQLRNVHSASQAATIWDSQYERSSGSTRSQRIANANSYFSNGFQSLGGETTGPVAGAGLSGGSAGGGGSQPLTAQDFSTTDGLGHLLSTVPELANLINKAVARSYTPQQFQNAVEDSKWWKTHSDTARSVLIQRANDPAAWWQEFNNTRDSITALSNQLGMHISGTAMASLTNSAMMTGNASNQQWLTEQLSHGVNFKGLKDLGSLTGGMANTAQQIEQMAGDYGYQWNPAQIAGYAQSVLSGQTTIDTYKQRLRSWAASAFPGLAQEIQGGATVKDMANPYMQSMSQLLEVDPGTLSLFTPAIRKALQGAVDPATKQKTTTPLWQFEDQIRNDPRWQYTQNAKDTVSTALLKIGSDFGFGPNA